MTTATKVKVDDIATQLDRLLPSQCEDGAGHIGHDHDDRWPTVGWQCEGGNRGEAVFSIHPDDVAEAVSRLEKLSDAALDEATAPGTPSLLADCLDGLRVEWHI